jgi:hypothetical protein
VPIRIGVQSFPYALPSPARSTTSHNRHPTEKSPNTLCLKMSRAPNEKVTSRAAEAEADQRRAVLTRLKTFIHLLLLVIVPLSAASGSPPSRSAKANRGAASCTRAISMGKRPGTKADADGAVGKRRAPGDTSTGEAEKLGSPLSPSVLVRV